MLANMRWDKALLAVVWLVFSIWTFRKLISLRPEDRVARKFGVIQFGLWCWAGMTVGGTLMAKQSDPNISLWRFAAYMGFVMFPVCVWGGYFWGRAMSAMSKR